MDPSMVTKMMPAAEPIPAVEDAFKEGRIGIGDRYNISLLPASEQHVPLELALGGASRDEVARESRKRRNGNVAGNGAPTVRTAKQIRIPLATDTATGTVTISGEAIDLEDAENILKEATKAIRSAKDQGLNVSTAQKVWKDRASAAGGAQ